MISLFFVCAVRGQIARWIVRKAKTIFADNFSDAEIILLAKYGQAKIAWSNFSVRCSHRFFRGHKSGSKNAVNFLDHDGPKKGCNPALRRSVLPLYATQWCQRCKNVTLCQRVTETPCHIPTVDFYFYVYFCSTIATQDSICAAS